MQTEFETVHNEPTVPTYGDHERRRYATRVWHSIDGELTCVRLYAPYERREDPEPLQ